MLEMISEKAEEIAMVQFMNQFNDNPFLLRFKEREYLNCWNRRENIINYILVLLNWIRKKQP